MLADIISSWEIVSQGLQGIGAALFAVLKLLFATPLLPFTLLGIARFALSSRRAR